jgi:hypothetical protein
MNDSEGHVRDGSINSKHSFWSRNSLTSTGLHDDDNDDDTDDGDDNILGLYK